MFANGMTPYVKYNMFHKEMKRKFLKNPFLQANMYYNEDQDYYVCPMGQHMEHTADRRADGAKRNSGGAFRQLYDTLYKKETNPFGSASLG